MTLLIACLLLANMGAGWLAYVAVVILWILHVSFHLETRKK